MSDLYSLNGKIPSGLTVSSTRLLIDGSGVTQPVSIASLPLPSGAATEASLVKLTLAQASTTSGQSGTLIQGAVTTAAPSYVTAQTNPLSLTTAGALRVDNSAVTQPVNQTQVNGVAVSIGNGVAGTGVQRVTVASDNTAFSVNPNITTISSASKNNVSVGTTSTLIIAANSNRKGLLITNCSAKVVFIQFGSAPFTTDFGFALSATQGPDLTFRMLDGAIYTGSVSGVVASGTASVTVVEFT